MDDETSLDGSPGEFSASISAGLERMLAAFEMQATRNRMEQLQEEFARLRLHNGSHLFSSFENFNTDH